MHTRRQFQIESFNDGNNALLMQSSFFLILLFGFSSKLFLLSWVKFTMVWIAKLTSLDRGLPNEDADKMKSCDFI